MSAWNKCKCPGTKKQKMKNWRVRMRRCNRSYFEAPAGQIHYSAYSQVICLNCYGNFRTKANYVYGLKDEKEEESQ